MFLLLLIGLGAASVKAQVRIGGNTPPNPAAALDLNANDDATPVGNKGALALPRVSLASTTAQLNGATPITGMLVYNTNASMTNGNGVGMYFWDGSRWVRVAPFEPSAIGQVTWTIVYDTLFIRSVTANTWNIVEAPAVSFGDLCYVKEYNAWVGPLQGYIQFAETNLAAMTNARWPIRCLRLTIK